jgi:hypothetical protein
MHILPLRHLWWMESAGFQILIHQVVAGEVSSEYLPDSIRFKRFDCGVWLGFCYMRVGEPVNGIQGTSGDQDGSGVTAFEAE